MVIEWLCKTTHTEATVHLTRKHRDCNDGTCPAIWDTDDPAVVGVQGTILTDPAALADAGPLPSHEQVVLLPRSLLMGYLKECL
jgi:hypothetical protein